MRIALLSYRSAPHVGGQGVYVRKLSAALAGRGHEVTVFSGQPYPDELDTHVALSRVPSLDLYNPEHPFRTPPVSSWRDLADLRELAQMWTAGFGEPRSFGDRIYRIMHERWTSFDVIHDNQSLGYGLAKLARLGAPVLTTIHHPITHDRRIALKYAEGFARVSTRRWYGFVRMQAAVARDLPGIVTVSASSKNDIMRDFGVPGERIDVIPCGIDTGTFTPEAAPTVRGRVVCVASADAPLKGVEYLLRAFACVAREVPGAHLELVSELKPNGLAQRLIGELGLSHVVSTHAHLHETDIAKLLASAQAACVPSLYEGFSLPALEALSCGTPLVGTRVGAIPELLGTVATPAAGSFVATSVGALARPGDVRGLQAALVSTLNDAHAAAAAGQSARSRVMQHFTWDHVAAAYERSYERLLGVGAPGGSNYPRSGE